MGDVAASSTIVFSVTVANLSTSTGLSSAVAVVTAAAAAAAATHSACIKVPI